MDNSLLFTSERHHERCRVLAARCSAQLRREASEPWLTLVMPRGVEEWKVRRWDFDPFGVEEEKPKAKRPRQGSIEWTSGGCGRWLKRRAAVARLMAPYGLIGGSGVQAGSFCPGPKVFKRSSRIIKEASKSTKIHQSRPKMREKTINIE